MSACSGSRLNFDVYPISEKNGCNTFLRLLNMEIYDFRLAGQADKKTCSIKLFPQSYIMKAIYSQNVCAVYHHLYIIFY